MERNEASLSSETRRNTIVWWFLGFATNLTWVANNAGAGDIVPGSYALIYLSNQVPAVLVKATGPYWFDLVSYNSRMCIAATCVALNYVMVAYAPGTFLKLIGVALGSIMSGLGEATCLGLSQKFSDPKKCLVMFSSGTGASGPAGYILNLYVFVHLNKAQKVVLGELIALTYALLYFYGLQEPQKGAAQGWEPLTTERQQQEEEGVHWSPQPKGGISEIESVVSPLQEGDGGGEDGRNDEADRGDDGDSEGSGGGGGRGDSSGTGGGGIADADEADTMDMALVRTSAPASKVETMRPKERFYFVLSLWPYLVPLFVVYWSEYVMQAGAWTSFAFDPDQVIHESKRDEAYQYFNFLYQWGVFISRSSGLLVSVDRVGLWAMPALQTALLIMFTVDSIEQFWNGYTLLIPSFIVGLLGGGVYVNAFMLINKEVEPALREMALSSACVADSTGILIADVMSLYWQWCLFAANGIADQADGPCPLG